MDENEVSCPECKHVRIKNALLRGTLEKCVKAMATVRSDIPLHVAMADEQFRTFFFAAKEGKALLENMRHES